MADKEYDKLTAMYIELCDMSWNSPEYNELNAKYKAAQLEYYGFIPCAIGVKITPEMTA